MAAMPRFDDRLPPKGKDGEDFQRFVWEALRSGHFELLLAGRYVRPHFAPGRDGAIDHVAVGAEDRIVFECKFTEEIVGINRAATGWRSEERSERTSRLTLTVLVRA